MQRICSALASRSLQADNAVGPFLALKKRGNGVVSVAGVPFVVNGLGHFDSRIFLEGFLDAANPFAKIELSGDGDDHDVSLAMEQLRHALAAFLAGAEVVRPDEKDATGLRRIGIHANNRYALLNGAVDGIPESLWIGGGNQDSRSVLRDRLLKSTHL